MELIRIESWISAWIVVQFSTAFASLALDDQTSSIYGEENDDANCTLSWAFHRLHGACMTVAWMACIPIGIFTARFMKLRWPTGWFQVHRIMVIIGIVFVCLGLFFIVFAHKGEFEVSAHSMCGILTASLTFTQPIIASLRPHNEANKRLHLRRRIFNWVHRTVGVTAFLLAVVSVFLGCKMMDVVGLPDTWAAPGLFVSAVFIIVVIAEMANKNVLKLEGNQYLLPAGSSDDDLLDAPPGLTTHSQNHWFCIHAPVKSDHFWSRLFGVFATVVSVLAAAMIVCIAMTPQSDSA